MIKFFIDLHGCAKNQVDAEILATNLIEAGFSLSDSPECANLILINSCAFIESAKTESINAVIFAKKNYPKAKIILTGCLSERYGENLLEDFFEADGFFGCGNLFEIANFSKKILSGERLIFRPKQDRVFDCTRKKLFSLQGSAYVKITEGCENNCSFCAIPLIRGHLRSREIPKIISEIKNLLSRGVFEINLVGQDLASFGRENFSSNIENCRSVDADFNLSPLARLLSEISKLSGNFWIRLLYIHPDNFNFDILPIMKADSRILPYFDIPFQSGSSETLLKMNRRGSAKTYLMMAKKIRSEFLECAIRTTFLVGFPGETENAAGETENFLQQLCADWAGTFEYSLEEGTPSYFLKNRVPKKIAKNRAKKLFELQSKITKEKLLKKVGKTYDVLIEEVFDKIKISNEKNLDIKKISDSEKNRDNDDAENCDYGIAIGRAWFQAPEVDGNVVLRYDANDKIATKKIKPGALVKAKIVSSTDLDLFAVFKE